MKTDGIEILAAFYRTVAYRHYSPDQRRKLLCLWSVIGGMEVDSDDYRRLVQLYEKVESYDIKSQEDAKFVLWLLSDSEEGLMDAVMAMLRSFEYACSQGYHVKFKTPIAWRDAVINGDGHDADRLMERGLIFYAEGRDDDALKVWSSLDHAEAKQCMAALYEIKRDYENALIQLALADKIFKEKLLLSAFPLKEGMEAAQRRLLSCVDAETAACIKEKANLAFRHMSAKQRDKVIGFV